MTEHSSKTTTTPTEKRTGKTGKGTTAAVWALRLIIGGVFIFSGWAKMVDPWGDMYKITEYISAMNISGLTRPTLLMAACVLATAEFGTGIAIATGCFRRAALWLAAAIMAIMTCLTLWIWISDPVPDCGCFGEAIILSNGVTFAKNIVLDIALAVLIWLNSRVKPAIASHLQWIAVTVTLVYAVVVQLSGYHFQPLVDFRPYKIGAQLFADSLTDDGTQYIYMRDGQEKSFTADNLPTDPQWQYVGIGKDGETAQYLEVFGPENLNDSIADNIDDPSSYLTELSETEGGLLLLVVPEPEAHGISRSQMANALYRYQKENDGEMAAVVATTDAAKWAASVKAKYPVFYTDDTDVKQLARGNAALVLVRDNKVTHKIVIDAVSPAIVDDIASGQTTLDAALSAPGTGFVRNITIVFAILLLTMMIPSMIPSKKDITPATMAKKS